MFYLLQVYTWALEIVEIYMFTFSIQVDSIIYAIFIKNSLPCLFPSPLRIGGRYLINIC